MKTDIQIAQEAVMQPITKVAEKLGIREDELELYGKYKAKFSDYLLSLTIFFLNTIIDIANITIV